jgi:hypothetical protein
VDDVGMRKFLLGVLTGLLLVAVAVVAVVLNLTRSAPVAPPMSSPPSSSSGVPTLARGQAWLGNLTLASSPLTTTANALTDVHATGTGVLLTDKGLMARTMTIDAILPFGAAASSVGPGVQLYAAGDGRAGLRRTVTLLGRDLAVTATGLVRAEDGLLVIEPKTVDLGGATWLDAAASEAVRSLVTVRQRVEGVPTGMRLTSVSVTSAGFRIRLQGSDVLVSTAS